MVSSHAWGGLAARAALLASGQLHQRVVPRPYAPEASTAIQTLQSWYDWSDGLWDTTGWWNSANCLTVLIDSGLIGLGDPDSVYISKVIANTYSSAQQVSAVVKKSVRADGLVQSTYAVSRRRRLLDSRRFPNFENEYYDDEGWWAWAFIRAFDFTRDPKYMDMAESIFADMVAGTDGTCGGGIWWNKDREYKNAISNELFLAAAAGFANRIGGDRQEDYVRIARDQWAWFQQSGLINPSGTINDGLTDGCTNNGGTVWSYNQGVILIGLVELWKATGDGPTLSSATDIALAAIRDLTDEEGILHDKCEPDCGADGSQFKGIFLRGLSQLQRVAPRGEFSDFIVANAKAILERNMNAEHQFGVVWSGPPSAGGEPDASSHSSASEAILAAVSL